MKDNKKKTSTANGLGFGLDLAGSERAIGPEPAGYPVGLVGFGGFFLLGFGGRQQRGDSATRLTGLVLGALKRHDSVLTEVDCRHGQDRWTTDGDRRGQDEATTEINTDDNPDLQDESLKPV